jgi:predicted HTH transcriptional regulator
VLLKPLVNLLPADILALIGNVPESKHLEYKSILPGGQDSATKEFVADVTAFANADGGHIVFGISEDEDAVATTIVGISVESRDAEERRLADIIRSGTEPRFSDFEFRWIDIEPNRSVLVLAAQNLVTSLCGLTHYNFEMVFWRQSMVSGEKMKNSESEFLSVKQNKPWPSTSRDILHI